MAVSNPSLSLFLAVLLVGLASDGYRVSAYAASSSGTHIQELNDLAHGYKDNVELEDAINEFNDKSVNNLRIYSIGKSVKGVPLLVMEISNNPGKEEAKPAFKILKFIGNVHGDEPVGRELLLNLANWLCENYKKDPLTTLIVENVHLHILPSMNPDGFSLRTRDNANNIDLNRDFPDQFIDMNDDLKKRQPETRAIMEWSKKIRFTASASIHGLLQSTMAVLNRFLLWFLAVLFLAVLLVSLTRDGYRVSGPNIEYAASIFGTPIPELDLAHSYKGNKELEDAIKEFNDKCVNISKIYSIGKSFEGVPLWVMEISNNPGKEEAKPAFKFIGNMHGDEPVGRELLLNLANWLCENYKRDPLATFIVDNVHLHILPSMNPDGFSHGTRRNANDIDLNRDFPDQFIPVYDVLDERQPEIRAVMEWSEEIRFTASASIHGGELVVSYPWDGTPEGPEGKKRYHACPDDEVFKYMAKLYSRSHRSMFGSEKFEQGITNGAQWFHIYGGMQDWNYKVADCFELTLEISDKKRPPADQLEEIWRSNQWSMLALVASVAKCGVHGRIFSSDCRGPLPACISVEGIDKRIQASETLGDYHRLLVPGHQYEVIATMPDYKTRSTTIIMKEEEPVTLDFILEPDTCQDNRFLPDHRSKNSMKYLDLILESLQVSLGLVLFFGYIYLGIRSD